MKVKKTLSRRKFLHGSLGGVAFSIGLPIFDSLLNNSGTAFAQGAPLPMRFGTFFWGLGCNSIGSANDGFRPTGSGAGAAWAIATGSGLSALNPYKDYLTVFSNYSYTKAQGADHIPSRGLSVSASHNPQWITNQGVAGFRGQNMPQASVDALVQQGLNPPTLLPFLNVSLAVGSLYVGTSSWGQGGTGRKFYTRATDLYNNVFKNRTGTSPAPSNPSAPSLSLVTNNFRKSVLDGTIEEAKAYSQTLYASDKLRLEAHLEGVRALEQQIAALIKMEQTPGSPQPTNPQCTGISMPQDYLSADQISLRNDVMADLIAYALSCDLTRVFCFEFTPTQCTGVAPEIGLGGGQGLHDGYSHAGNSNEMKTYFNFAMKNFASLIGKIKAKGEGSGNLLDSSLIMGTSEYGPLHFHNYHPYIFAGKGGGRLKGNYHSTKTNANNNEASRVLLTAAHGVGVKLPSLGMATMSTVGGGGPATTANYQTSSPITEVLV